jgi:hypothetical protein
MERSRQETDEFLSDRLLAKNIGRKTMKSQDREIMGNVG